MEVLDWEQMMNHKAYQVLQMEQQLEVKDKKIITTRCPIRINGNKIYHHKPAPQLGEHNEAIYREFIK